MKWTPRTAEPDPLLTRVNAEGKTIQFPGVSTEGACLVARVADALQIIPLPEGTAFTARIKPSELGWTLPAGTQVESLAEDGTVQQRVPLVREGDEWVLKCEPGVFAYRLGGK